MQFDTLLYEVKKHSNSFQLRSWFMFLQSHIALSVVNPLDL